MSFQVSFKGKTHNKVRYSEHQSKRHLKGEKSHFKRHSKCHSEYHSMCQYKYTKYSKKTSFKEESIKMSLKESSKFNSKTHHWLTYSLDERVCGVSPIRSKSGTPLSAGPREVSSPSTCCSMKSLKIPLRLNLDLEQTWEDDPVCYWRQSDCSTHGSGSGSHPWYQGDVNQRKVGLWLLQQERERAERAGYYDARVSCWY